MLQELVITSCIENMCVLREQLTHRGSAFSIENFQDQKRKKETALYELKRLKKVAAAAPA